MMPIVINDSFAGIDWVQAKVDLAAVYFDNGRSPAALRSSFEHSQYVATLRGMTAVSWDRRGFFPTAFAMPTC